MKLYCLFRQIEYQRIQVRGLQGLDDGWDLFKWLFWGRAEAAVAASSSSATASASAVPVTPFRESSTRQFGCCRLATWQSKVAPARMDPTRRFTIRKGARRDKDAKQKERHTHTQAESEGRGNGRFDTFVTAYRFCSSGNLVFCCCCLFSLSFSRHFDLYLRRWAKHKPNDKITNAGISADAWPPFHYFLSLHE